MYKYYWVFYGLMFLRGPYRVRAVLLRRPFGGLAVDPRDITVPVQVTYLPIRIYLYTVRVPCGRRKDALRCTYEDHKSLRAKGVKVFSIDHTWF